MNEISENDIEWPDFEYHPFVCQNCFHIHYPSKNFSFYSLNNNWLCPCCLGPKSDFIPYED